MGRKALSKDRKKNQNITREWMRELFPYFQANGLRGVTMDLVAQELQKSKTTLYEYFQTKEELVMCSVEYKLEKIQGFVAILENESLGFLDRYYQALQHLAKHNSDISTLFLADLKAFYPECWEKIDQFLGFAAQVLEKFYQSGIEQGVFRKINTWLLVETDQLFFRTLADPDFLLKSSLTLNEAFEQYLGLKFFGLIQKEQAH
jgi:AcrR family transcriptional regulator